MTASQIIVGICGLSLLVIVHEGGHYLAARAFGMRVTRFSIGLGPTIVSYRPKNSPTTFQLCAVPFLAYVMIAGMNPAEEIDPNDDSLYPNKGVFARIVTIFGGPFANYLAASTLVLVLGLGFGWPEKKPTEPMVVDIIEPGSPAAKSGLLNGDVIVQANGKPIRNVDELRGVTGPRAGKPTQYVIERAGKRIAPITIVPRPSDHGGLIGVGAKSTTTYRPMTGREAALLALIYPFDLTMQTLVGLRDQIVRRTTDGLTGPVGMGKLVADQAGRGAFAFIQILAAISVALGAFNLLPFPALDGGRLVFLGYELITRRRPNERIETAVHTVGLLLLLGLVALVTLRDVLGLLKGFVG